MNTNTKNTVSLLNQEEIYALLASEDWASLLVFVAKNSKLIATDEILKHAIISCENTFFSNLDKERTRDSFASNLISFHDLHIQSRYSLADKNFKLTILELVVVWMDRDLELARTFADNFPEEDICKKLIEKHESSLPKLVAHQQRDHIQVSENRNVSSVDGRIPLFKSFQEKEFFYAVRDAFPHFIVYPNVSVSCVIDFEKVKQNLSKNEREYFFKSILDCVVFDDKDKSFIPIYFFELDSRYHDNEKQKQKDVIKDKILAMAGQKLYRIRRIGKKQKRDDFEQLVKDLLKK